MTQNPREIALRLNELRSTEAEQIAALVKDHTKAELARIIVAGRIHHAERDLAESHLTPSTETARELLAAALRHIGDNPNAQCVLNGAGCFIGSKAAIAAITKALEGRRDISKEELSEALSLSQQAVREEAVGLLGEGEARKAWITAEQELLEQYLDGYEMGTDGADYTPTEWERVLLADALQGWLIEHDELLRKHLFSSHPKQERGS